MFNTRMGAGTDRCQIKKQMNVGLRAWYSGSGIIMNNPYKADVFPLTVTQAPASPDSYSWECLWLCLSPVLRNESAYLPHSRHLKGPLRPGFRSSSSRNCYHGCHPGRGRLSWFCVLSPGPEAALLPALSLTQPFTVYSGLLTKSSLRGLKTHPQAWLRVSPSSIPLWDFSISPFFPLSTNTLLLFPSSQANSSSANQLLLIDTCRGHQPPRSTVSRGWYELSREEPWAQGLESEVKHHIFPNHSVMRENSRELLGLRVGVSAIEWVLAI